MSRRPPHRSARRPNTGWRAVAATAATPNTTPTRDGFRFKSEESHSDTAGSSIATVDAATTTVSAQIATARTLSNWRSGTASRAACVSGGRSHRKPIAAAAASPATVRNGSLMPPVSYSQPPSEGPIIRPKLVPDMTNPITRPRSAGP